ncbi:uncharacterized protein CG5098 isoform X2 [Drosophila persimilis]|uniref:uncharacterized protein CG5098 isoform X2 n=1 Tax=Drosophila persimilis TaxID=7234 RepID=UPI000F07C6B7|nr:uncharacterized protein CG5098 isoform X2 [Drosophila persimilis]
MANNNHPHGHLSQAAQNPSWNPLQIPSYIPRQPQLAHMSNERPMVRSPLAWHASVSAQPPPPPDALYNFMSANHKNLDHHHQMNPLLAPPYSGTLPFDSMDLSLQSARSAAQPLAKQPQQSQQQPQQQQQSLMHAPNYPTIQNLATNAAPTSAQLQQQQGHLAAMAAAHAMLQSGNQNAASSLVLSNGSDCESLLPRPPPTANLPPGSSSNHTGSNNNIPSPQYLQNRDENFKLSQLKRSFEQEVLSSKNLQKDKLSPHNLQHQQQHANKKPSPLRNYHQQQQQQQPPYNLTPKYNGPQTPPTPQSPLAGPPHQMHSPTMDYNQLHLHHQLNSGVGGSHGGGGYQHMQQDQPQPQHLHYHNQHVGNQPVSAASPLHPPPPHLVSSQFHAQQQSTGQQQQQAPSTPQQTTHHSRSSQLTNLESMAKQKTQPETENQTVITDLSYRNATPSLPPAPAVEVEKPPVTDAPESPYLTTSNEESLESNSNSSNSRKRRKRKSSLVMRVTPNENATEGGGGASASSTTMHQQPGNTPSINSNICSPKHSPKIAGSDFQPFGMQSESQNDKTPQENGRGSSPSPTENSNSSTLYNDENPKTKKQRQALLQRNLTEQQRIHHEDEPDKPVKHTPPTMPPPSPQSNSSSSSSSSSSGNTHSSHSSHATGNDTRLPEKPENDETNATTDTPASPALVEQGNIDARPAVSVHECDEEEEPVGGGGTTKEPESPPQPAPAPSLPQVPETAGTAAPPAQETPPAVNSEHSTFGEVEDKLEEMFAGIEEEPEQNGPPEKPAQPAGDAVAHDLSAQLALDSAKDEDKPAGTRTALSASPATNLSVPMPEVRPVATKAAKKSTLPSPVHSPTPETRSTSTPLTGTEDIKSPSIQTSSNDANSRRLPPRRLSIGMDASLLRFVIDEHSDKAKKAVGRGRKRAAAEPELDSEDDDKPSTSAAAAAALAVRQQNEVAAAKAAIAKPTASKKKNAGGKGKKGAAGKSKAKQNGKKSAAGGRKPPTTDEDSTPAPTNGGGGVDLRFKSPFILIKPDGSVSIKNTHSAEDVNEKQTKAKKAPHERKSLRGMHSSTLSNRYDADTTDSTWICVFCKRGPHKMGLGDLFGPYLVSIDCEEYRAALQAPGSQDFDGVFVSKRRREDMVQHRRNLPVVPATLAHIMQAPKISMHKRKRKQIHDSMYAYSDDPNESLSQSSQDPLDCSTENRFVETFRGMCKTSDHGYEVWLHEDCAVWTNDIQLIGAHVNGLDAAVWDSTRYQCAVCFQTGASVCCFQRCCKATAHVPCARSTNWTLDEQERKVFCQMHGQLESQTHLQPPEVFKAEPVAAAPPAVAPPPKFDVSSLP